MIDPLNVIPKYGTDALRMGLIIGNTPGTDLSLSEDKIKGYKHFANKIWNASRFVLSNTENLKDVNNIIRNEEFIFKSIIQLFYHHHPVGGHSFGFPVYKQDNKNNNQTFLPFFHNILFIQPLNTS